METNISTATSTAFPRIALFGTGFVSGSTVKLLRQLGWPIVAAFNRAGPKIGRDLGQVLDLGEDIGVTVQDGDQANYGALDADVAVIAGPDHLDDAFPIYERFLRAGINVLSYGSSAYKPSLLYPKIAAKIDALARANGVTFTGGGLWDSTRIWPGLLTGAASVRIDALDYATDTEGLRQGTHWAPVLGIGLTVTEFDRDVGREVGRLNEVLRIPAIIVLEHYGYTVTSVAMRQEPVVFDEPVYCPYLKQTIDAGRVAGTRTLIEIATKEGATSTSRFDYRVFRPGEIEHGTWRVVGSPSMEIRVVREHSAVTMASSLLNRVQDVIRAAPGIATIMDLGPARPRIAARGPGGSGT